MGFQRDCDRDDEGVTVRQRPTVMRILIGWHLVATTVTRGLSFAG